ncbi:hypothetical protein [Actinoplanes sp. CA-252034]|uniref:hypothetical protein n=1 Tax=Actinoplanes sp. CA-252034 TaxID=3239906 RepID=UPI003D997011
MSAFIELFDRTYPAVRTALTTLPIDGDRRDDVLAASYLEVWWLAGCRTEPGLDVVEWIIGIARRRIGDTRLGPTSPVEPVEAAGRTPGYALRELAALLCRPVGTLEPG